MSEARDFTPAERVALDRVTVPAMRAGVAAGAVSAALAEGSGKPTPRRAMRSSWRRPGRMIVGATALLLVSAAAAAATGLLEKLPLAIPGITRLAATPEIRKPSHVVPVSKPRPVAARRVEVATAPADETVVQQPMAMPVPLGWRERRAARIAAGLPVQPLIAGPGRGTPIERLATLPPEVRQIVVARYLANHPRIAARLEQRGIDPTTDDGQRRLARMEHRRAMRAFEARREEAVEQLR